MHDILTAEDSVVRFDREATESDGRSIIVRLLSWGEVANTPEGRETFDRGAFAGVDPEDVYVESQRHDGAIVGRGESIEEADDGPYLRARISETTEGTDLLRLITDGVLTRASISFIPEPGSTRVDGGILHRTRARIRRLAILPKGAYPSAQVLAVREEHDVTETTPEVTTEAVDLTPITDRLDHVDEAIARITAAQETPAGGTGGPLDRFDSFGDAFMAATTDPEVAQALNRVLADNTLATNPGLAGLQNGLSIMVDRIYRGRPIVNAFGISSPGDTGMTVSWPVFDETSDFAVTEQAAEKDEVGTGQTKYTSANATLQTIAGGSDNSLQVLQRSTPSFRELLLRNYGEEYAAKADALMAAEVVANGTAYAGASVADADAILATLFGMSSAVEDASGSPANIAMASSDVWLAMGQTAGLLPRAYGTQNVAGVAQANTLVVEASGMVIMKARALPAQTLVLANSASATFMEDGPRTIEELNVAQLGRDIAIYGFVAPVILRAGGVQVGSTVTLPTP